MPPPGADLAIFANRERAQDNLARLFPPTAVGLAEAQRDLLQMLADSPDPDLALNSLERIASASGSALAVMRTLGERPEALTLLTQVLGSSHFLADALVRNPEYLALFFDAAALAQLKTHHQMLHDARASTQPFAKRQGKMNALRRYRRKEVLRIAAADLGRLCGFRQVVAQVSSLAQACIQVAWEMACAECGLDSAPLAVIGLGKLGGGELNYASDVDLLFVFQAPEDDASAAQRYGQLASQLVEIVGTVAEEGRLLRPDLRLRPEGATGPLARSLSSTSLYYEEYGEAWERQALVKARWAAGDQETGRKFEEHMRSFVYAKRLEPSALADMERMKNRYEEMLREAARWDTDVKQGYGGIRDVEFATQILQLLCGADDPSVRQASTLDALTALRAGGYLTEQEHRHLTRGYIFLREVEHRLQIMFELPLHTLPATPERLRSLAVCCGFKDGRRHSASALFLRALRRHQDRVRKVLTGVLEPVRPLGEAKPPDRVRSILARYGFPGPEKALRLLNLMEQGPTAAAGRSLSQMLDEHLEAILEACTQSGAPLAALGYFERFSNLLGTKDAFYQALHDVPHLVATLCALGGAAPFLSEILISRPQFLDTLADSALLDVAISPHQFKQWFEDRAEQAHSYSERLGLLRTLKARELLCIGVRDLLGLSPPEKVGEELTALAEGCVQVAFSLVAQDTGMANAVPEVGDALAMIGLGRFGSQALHYRSDLDLIIVGQEGDAQLRAAQQRAAQEFIRALEEPMVEGSVYQVDLRLRPGGKAAALVTTPEAFLAYAAQFLETWERQALSRARFVAGNPEVGNRFLAIASDATYSPGLTADQVREIVHLRSRILAERSVKAGVDVKLGRGGLLELEFTVQMLQLAQGRHYPGLRTPNTQAALLALMEAGLISPECRNALDAALRFLRRVESRLQMSSLHYCHALPESPGKLGEVARQLGYRDRPPLGAGVAFLQECLRHVAEVRTVWDQTVATLQQREATA